MSHYQTLIENGEFAEVDAVSDEMISCWLPVFSKMSWLDRLRLLEQIDEQIQFDCNRLEIYQKVSQGFTAKLIDNLEAGDVTCEDQAYVYMNSSRASHRQAGRAWLVLYRPNCPLLHGTVVPSLRRGWEKRSSPRHQIDLPSILAIKGILQEARLVDISSTGAKASIETPPPLGTEVVLEVPFIGRIAASVVWATATFVGLAFVGAQSGIA